MSSKKFSKFPPKKPDNSHIVKMAPKRNWSEYQKNIFKDIAQGVGHTVVIARAGSGKTSTIVEGFRYIPRGKKTLMVAFNKSIADELKQRAPSYVDVMTLHSLGFRAIKQSFGNVILETDKCRSIVASIIGDDRDLWELNQSLCKCVSLCKSFLYDTPKRIEEIIDNFGIETFDLEREKFIEHTIRALGLCKASKLVVDFDDMIWFPFVYRLNVGKFDVVFVDECFPYDQCIATKNGKIKIGHIFNDFSNHKTLPLVKTFNENTEEFEYKKIVNVWDRGEKTLVEIQCGKRKIKCTSNHKFLTHKGWVEAANLLSGDLIKTTTPIISGSQIEGHLQNALNTDQYQIVLGSFLGDGHIQTISNHSLRMKIIHGNDQKEYCQWKANMFGAKTRHVEKNGYAQKPATVFCTKSFSIPGSSFPTNKKHCPQWILDELDDRGLAIWFMDDGSVNSKTADLWTSSFDDESHSRIVSKLHSMGIECKSIKYFSKNRNKFFTKIRVNAVGYKVLVKRILPYMHQNLMYKIQLTNSEYLPYEWDHKFENYGFCAVDSVINLNKTERVYDIEVESNHNFIVCSGSSSKSNTGLIAHNCQDLNAAQIAMVLSAIKPEGRAIAVGDPAQCVHEDTIIEVDGKLVSVKDCKAYQNVLCFTNGKLDSKKIIKKVKSSWDWGYEITTLSGKKLLMSPNHKIWASSPVLDSQYIVYLMYRKDLGFRVGKTNTWKSVNYPLGLRANSENADRLWVLDIVSSNEEALFLELKYSLEYSIPTSVFNGQSHGINQYRLNKVFKFFGKNGFNLLSDRFLDFAYPHWIASSNSNNGRKTIRVNAHSQKGTQVTLEWKNKELDQIFIDNKITFSTGKNSRIRKYFTDYVSALEFARTIEMLSDAKINERLSILGSNPYLLTASSLHIGMKVYSKSDNTIIEDEIISLENKDGVFYDLEVESSANFIGNDILSHNSIYQFRGADSEAIPNFINKLKAKTLPLSVTYRCPKKIVKLAQEIVPDIEAHESAAEGTIVDLDVADLLRKVKPGDFVLSRTNAPLIKHCLALLKSGVPANIQGRDVGANLIYFIKKSKAKTIVGFTKYVNDWRDQEVERLMANKRDTTTAIDKAECLLNLCEGTLTLADLKETIEKLFNDTDDSAKVIFSTTHKAKGLERDRVFILADTYRRLNGGEEANLWYVAVTRSKSELYLCRKPSKYAEYDDFNKDKLHPQK